MATHQNDDVTIERPTSGGTIGLVTPSSSSGRFLPGAIVSGRYRLVALLGKGGMGEVYRADDLTLDQPVALKFLPAGVAANDTRLAQFHNELRTARQVSHKNVCRLYDLGDADGRRFLTMEYVDGEDLSSSLRRFGRMPPDKAIQIARQVCAGVAAAHERGVLHRDLKPANVMLDGNGDVRITDFGIATAVADVGAAIAGTPQYMAPELLAGKPASTKSDIYALGLILFEIFTGKRAFDAKTIGELQQLHDTATVTTPSSLVRDLDPAVERIILRCLEKDPDRRPASALTVAASLPGGDPLAAALAAGETPSPELLVAAGESQAMPVRLALGMAIGFLVVLAASVGPISRGSVAGHVAMDIPRDALADRADQMLRKLGYTDAIADRASGFSIDRDYLRWAERNGANDWWSQLRAARPSPVTFWYRTSPVEMMPTVPAGRVEPVDPPMNVAGMRELSLDSEGRAVEFHAVPPADTSAPAAAIFLVLRLLLRRPRVALAAGIAVLLVAMNGGSVISGTWIDTYNVIAFTAVMTFVIQRVGLLAAATTLFVDNIISDVPLTTNLSAWWSGPTALTLALVIGLVCFAYTSARAGEPLFGAVLND